MRLPRVAVSDPVRRWWTRQTTPVQVAVGLAFLAFAILFPLTLSTYWQSVLYYPVGVFVLLALGLNIVVGFAGLLDLGYVAFYAVGAYTTAKLTTTLDWNPWAAIPVAIALAMLAGVVLGAPTLRLRGDYLAIVTLGFGEIVRIIAQNTESLGAARGIPNIPHPPPHSTFGEEPLPYYYLTLAAVALGVLVVLRLRGSRVGRAWAAIREDEDAAEAMGVPTFTMKLWAFAMGAFTGGLGGWIYASKVGFISPDNFTLFLSIYILSAVVLGGMGSVPGVLAGAFAIAFLPEYLRTAAAGETLTDWLNTATGGDVQDITEYRVFLFGAALVAVMIFRPQGLFPSRERAEELADAGHGTSLGATAPPPAAVDEEPVDEAVTSTAVEPGATAASPGPPAVAAASVAVGAEATAILTLRGVTMTFGGVTAIRAVDLTVREREIFGIIGPNGAGKTTLFNCVTGVFRPTAGDIAVRGRSVVGRRPHQITHAGVARTFQNIRLFPALTALGNVLVGTDARHRTSVPGALVGAPRHRREERTGREEAHEMLDFVGIGHRTGDVSRNLPYGDQRRLEIARALATGADVLLLDEPAAGMNPSEKRALTALIRRIRDRGVTVVLIEHDMGLVMQVCDRVAVLDFGEKIAEGTPAEIQQDERVISAYLGVPTDAA